MGELCSLVYLINLQRLEARVSTQVIVTGVAQALGAEVDMPDPDDEIADFRARLCEPPKTVDRATLNMRYALGLER